MNSPLQDLIAKKTWLIDLDGTLIQEHFIFKFLAYPLLITRLIKIFGWYNVRKKMELCRQALLNIPNQYTNYERLLETAHTLSSQHPETTRTIIENFFKKDYPQLCFFYKPINHAKETLEEATKLGYKLVLATNPVWPESCVNLRLRQCGFDPKMFSYITHAEVMHSTKPQQSYFAECLTLIHATPSDVAMIGNDINKDGSCQTANIFYYSVATKPSTKWLEILTTLRETTG